MSGVDSVLTRGLSAIEPYLDVVVVAGGWVPHLYELLYDATNTGRSPRTRDIDLAVPRSVPVRGASIDQMLVAAEFECRYTSVTKPPVTKYSAVDDGQEIEIEFITDAPGARQGVVTVQSGLTAQELHYVGLMLVDPWIVDLGELTDGEVGYAVRVPNPGAFIFHKSLVFVKRRDRLKKEKDLYYIFFVLDTFPEWRGLIAAELVRLAAQKSAWFRKSRKSIAVIFDCADSAGVDALLNQRPLTAYTGMNDEQFRQYAFSVMCDLIEMMDSGLATSSSR